MHPAPSRMRVKFVVEMQLSERELLSEPPVPVTTTTTTTTRGVPRDRFNEYVASAAAAGLAGRMPMSPRPRSGQLGGSTLERADAISRQQSEEEKSRQRAALAQMDSRQQQQQLAAGAQPAVDPWYQQYAQMQPQQAPYYQQGPQQGYGSDPSGWQQQYAAYLQQAGYGNPYAAYGYAAVPPAADAAGGSLENSPTKAAASPTKAAKGPRAPRTGGFGR